MEYSGATKSLSLLQTIEADSVHAHGSADIHLSPDEKFLYVSNRLEADGVVVFKVNNGGQLQRVGYQPTGKHPRNFMITPSGNHLLVACRDDNNIEIYKRDAATGLLSATGKSIKLPSPVFVIVKN